MAPEQWTNSEKYRAILLSMTSHVIELHSILDRDYLDDIPDTFASWRVCWRAPRLS